MYNWRDDRENRFRTQFKDVEPVYDEATQAITGYTGNITRETKGGIDNCRNKNARLEDQRVQSYSLTGTHLLSPRFGTSAMPRLRKTVRTNATSSIRKRDFRSHKI